MHKFEDSYLGKLRQHVGSDLLLVPGARVVIENDADEILLQKRSDLDVWGLPGGNAEPGEDLASVAIRETMEETGLTIYNVNPFGFGCDPDLETIQFPNGDLCQFFVMNFYTLSFESDLKISDDESTELRWFRPNALPNVLPNMQASVAAYLEFCSTGAFQMIQSDPLGSVVHRAQGPESAEPT